jgi:predicted dehydrogenase
VEKPIAASLAEARLLAEFPTLAVGHTERFNPILDVLRGEAPAFWQAERLAPWMDRGTDVDVVLDLMIHDLDLFLGHVGGAVTEVRANGLSVVSGRIDIVHARVETTRGVGLFTASRISRKAVRTTRAFVPGGYYSLDLKDKVGLRVGTDLHEELLTAEPRDALRAELTAFLAGTSPVRGADALAALELAERVRAACG